MNVVASLDSERVRAVRVELARLVADRYRNPGHEPEIREELIERHVNTLPEDDRAAFRLSELSRMTGHSGELDWSILKDEKVQKALIGAVNGVVARWPEKLSATKEDLFQSGCVILAERHAEARREMARGRLDRWLYQNVRDLVRYERRDISIEVLGDAL